MKTLNISDELYEELKKLAECVTPVEQSEENGEDFFNASEWYGQYDDAFDGGVDTGEINLARRIIIESAKEEIKDET